MSSGRFAFFDLFCILIGDTKGDRSMPWNGLKKGAAGNDSTWLSLNDQKMLAEDLVDESVREPDTF